MFGDDLVRALDEEEDLAECEIAECGGVDGCGGCGVQEVEE